MDILKHFEKRMKQHLESKIQQNNATVRSSEDIENTTVRGYRGAGTYQRVKFSTTPDNDEYMMGGGSGNIVAP